MSSLVEISAEHRATTWQRAFQTIKNLFRKAQGDNKDPYIAPMKLSTTLTSTTSIRTDHQNPCTDHNVKLHPRGYKSECVSEELQSIKGTQKYIMIATHNH